MASPQPQERLNQAASGKPLPRQLRLEGLKTRRNSQDELRLPRTFTGELMAVPQSWQGQNPVFLSAGTSEKEIYFLCKRCADLCLAGLVLILLLPLLVLIALLVKIDSSGPIFFTHERVGAKRLQVRGEAVWVISNFRMHKFRSMVQDADSAMHEAYIRSF